MLLRDLIESQQNNFIDIPLTTCNNMMTVFFCFCRRYFCVALLLLAIGTSINHHKYQATAFQLPTSHPTISKASCLKQRESVVTFRPRDNNDVAAKRSTSSSTTTSLLALPISSDVILPTLLMIGAIAYTVLYGEELEESDYISKTMAASSSSSSSATTTTSSSSSSTTDSSSNISLVKSKEDDTIADKKEEKPVVAVKEEVKKTSPPPPPKTTSTLTTSTSKTTKPVSEIRKQVARTVDEAIPQKQILQRSAEKEAKKVSTTEPKKASSKEFKGPTTKEKRKPLRLVVKVLKKIIMPWRKWKNL